jgi:hypothetical protein
MAFSPSIRATRLSVLWWQTLCKSSVAGFYCLLSLFSLGSSHLAPRPCYCCKPRFVLPSLFIFQNIMAMHIRIAGMSSWRPWELLYGGSTIAHLHSRSSARGLTWMT